MEIWKIVKSETDTYEVSSNGLIRHNLTKELIRCQVVKAGYVSCPRTLNGNRFVHRIVAEAFIGKIPSGFQVNHKNGDKADNRVENLEIVTASENNLHAFRVLKRSTKKGEKHPMSKYSEEMIHEIRWLFAMGARQFHLAKEYCVDPTVIRDIVHRKRWKHI